MKRQIYLHKHWIPACIDESFDTTCPENLSEVHNGGECAFIKYVKTNYMNIDIIIFSLLSKFC